MIRAGWLQLSDSFQTGEQSSNSVRDPSLRAMPDQALFPRCRPCHEGKVRRWMNCLYTDTGGMNEKKILALLCL